MADVQLPSLPEMKETVQGLKVLEASINVICTKSRGFAKNPIGILQYAHWHPFMNHFLKAIGDPDGLVYRVSERIVVMGDFAAQSVAQEIDLSLVEDEPETVEDAVKMCEILAADLLIASTQARRVGALAAPQFDFGTIETIVPVAGGLEHWGAEFRRMTGKR
jgi:DNA-binding ferritin-like protein